MKRTYVSVVKGTSSVQPPVCTQTDCISGQSSDLLGYLCAYLGFINILQVRQISSLFKKIVYEKVSIVKPCTIRFWYFHDSQILLNGALRVIKMFKKAKLNF